MGGRVFPEEETFDLRPEERQGANTQRAEGRALWAEGVAGTRLGSQKGRGIFEARVAGASGRESSVR